MLIRNAVVAALIRNNEGKVFIQQREEGKEYGGMWELPGGKVNNAHPLTSETLEEALHREIKEETQGKIRIIWYLCSFEKTGTTGPWKDQKYLLHFFYCKPAIGHNIFRPTAKYAWITKDELKNYLFCNEDLEVLTKFL